MTARSIKVGQWVRVMYDCVGARDGIVVEKDNRDSKDCKVFFPFEGTAIIGCDQVIAVGGMVDAAKSGIKPFAGFQLSMMKSS